jgi:hypothetical protein
MTAMLCLEASAGRQGRAHFSDEKARLNDFAHVSEKQMHTEEYGGARLSRCQRSR